MQTHARTVGTVGIPRKRPRVREVRTVEHLEHQDRALLELSDSESPETLLLLYQLKKCEDVSTHGGHGRGEAGNMQTHAAHDVSAKFGTVNIPRKASRIGGFLELNQMHTAQKRRFSLGSHGWHIQSACRHCASSQRVAHVAVRAT